ncbi:MAG: hypothetical protein IJJ69_06840 [Oscillospiraceae bacterium]|nr:hypothetical protein [Oscillospiraceae bacterium]
MNFFCKVHMQSSKEKEVNFFMVLIPEKKNTDEIPQLSKEMVLTSQQYLDFRKQYKPRNMLVEYTVYATETEINAAMSDEEFQKLTETAEKQPQAEISIDCIHDKPYSSGKKKKKKSPVTMMIAVCSIFVVGVFGVGFGMKVGKSKAAENEKSIKAEKSAEEDGLLIPEQEQNEDAAQQITISIDRSYLPIPTEDLQLKGSAVDGKAQITLPEFDKTDFFTHVAGYTWGFSSDPDAKRIEYYGGKSYTFTEDTKLYRVLVKYGGGSGTKDDPYLIDYYDQLELMSEEKARGYFKQTADIIFPDWASHTPIDTVNELKSNPDSEHFEFDGDGYIIENLDNPLFGKVSGAVIKNINITNSTIETTEYKDYGFVVCSAYNYRYNAEDGTRYETGETLIQHCTVSHSSILARYPQTDETQATEVVTAPAVVPPDLVEYDENGNIIEPKEDTEPVEPTRQGEHAIGAITGLGGQIENCYVRDFGISAYLDDYILYAGGISGKPANVLNSAVYGFSAKGRIFNGGGIAGSISGAKMYNPAGKELPTYYGGNIQGCVARKITLYTENSAGGIAGEGSTSNTDAVVSNCYATNLNFSVGVFEDSEREKLKKTGVSGGIIGTDGNERNGHLITATVSPANLSVIGSKKVSSYDDTIRLAPDYAFYQQNILSVINQNTINPENPKEIFAGSFKFSSNDIFGDDTGSLAYPAEIEDLFEKTITEEST